METKLLKQSPAYSQVTEATTTSRDSINQLRDPVCSLTGRDLADVAGGVLLVMTNTDECRQLAKTLANLGCKVRIASDGETSLQMTAFQQPDLLVLDIELPGRNGFQICAELRLPARTRHIPVILLSSTLAAEEKMRGLRLGAVDCITKPCDWAEVAAQVCSQLELGRVRSELALANFNLLAVQAQHQAELKAAAAVQKSLLPRFATEHFRHLSISWRFLPLDQVGGDLLGYAWLDEDHLAAYVVDVCGHGLPAAMMTAAISISLAPSIASGDETQVTQRTAFSPKEMLEKLDREYPIERFDCPFTISYLVLNRKSGEFRCSRAGHPMPIIIRQANDIESIEAGGTMIGLDRMLPFDEGVGRLNPGDSILLYSDGVTECRNLSEVYGLERLCSVLRRSSGCSPEVLCDNIMFDLLRFNSGAAMQDDSTILALTYGSSQK
jgi:phosphoserine phosphatase RsbU/P